MNTQLDPRFSDDEVLAIMLRFGGGFVASLAKLYRQADVDNRRILRQGFSHYFVQYADMLEQHPAVRKELL